MGMYKRHFSRVRESAWTKIHKTDAVVKQEHKCIYCKTEITIKLSTAEHKISRKNGGLTNKENIAASCEPCNQTKGSRNHNQFMDLIHRNNCTGMNINEMFAWSRRRINLKTNRACKNIMALCK